MDLMHQGRGSYHEKNTLHRIKLLICYFIVVQGVLSLPTVLYCLEGNK